MRIIRCGPLQIVAANETYLNLTALSRYGETTSVIDKGNDNITIVTWKFKYSGYPRPQFDWNFKSSKLDTHDTSDKALYRGAKYVIDEHVNSKLLTLQISNALDKNVGDYTLVATNGFNTIEKTFDYAIDRMNEYLSLCQSKRF